FPYTTLFRSRVGIVEKFKEWKRAGLCTIAYQTHSNRPSAILRTNSIRSFRERNPAKAVTHHDGVFLVALIVLRASQHVRSTSFSAGVTSSDRQEKTSKHELTHQWLLGLPLHRSTQPS